MKLNKKQKRTATIASMAALLAVVLGMGGSTFAKYVTNHTTQAQTAVVAKWGVVIQSSLEGDNGTPVFNKTYNNGAISSSSTSNVVAPGASGSITITVTGAPEVKAAIKFELKDFKDVALSASGQETYYPIVWSWNNAKIERETGAEAKSMETLIKEKFASASKAEVAANAGVGTTFTLSWSWPFEGNDAMDTLCGDAAANGNTVTANKVDWTLQNEISFNVVSSVTQLEA